MTIATLNVPRPQHVESPFNPIPIPVPVSVRPVLSRTLSAPSSQSIRLTPSQPAFSLAIPAVQAQPGPVLPNGQFCAVQPLNANAFKANVDFMVQEGWDVNFHDMKVIYEKYPNCFYVAQTFDGRVIGHISGLHLNTDLGMLSYCIVHHDYQNQGLGSKLMKVGQDAMEGRVTAFYSLEDKVPFYKRRGYETRRFTCLVRDFILDKADFGGIDDEEKENDDPIVVKDARLVSFDKLRAYDIVTHGRDRGDYLKRWILRNEVDGSNQVLAAYDKTEERVVGFLALTRANNRWDINPLYADSDAVAQRLLKAAAISVGQAIRVYVRIPSGSSSAIKLFQKCRDIKHKRILYLMSDRALPQSLSADKVYSLSTVCYGLK